MIILAGAPEAQGAAVAAVEDERAVRSAPGLLALDDRHQLRCVLAVHGYLERALRLVQLGPEDERLLDLGVVAPFESQGLQNPQGRRAAEKARQRQFIGSLVRPVELHWFT